MRKNAKLLPYRNEEPIPLTPEGIERIRARHTRLKKALPELAAEAERTAAFGDRSDNAEYKQAKGALRYTHYEIYRLEDQLKRAVAITSGRNTEGTVQLGSVVVVVAVNGTDKKDNVKISGAQKTFEILGPMETSPGEGRISNRSPLGAALMGHVTGDVITIQTANGSREYKITEVR
jgi:transcription elongation factor GreA